MKRSPVERLLALMDDVSTRRTLTRGLAGLTAISAMELLGLDAADARKKGKSKKKRKKRNRRPGGGNNVPPGSDNPPSPPPPTSPPPTPPPPPPGGCDGTICDGRCVDLNNDDANCGACGVPCTKGATCVNRVCVIAIGSEGDGDGEFDNPSGIALNASGTAFVTDTNNNRLVALFGGQFGNAALSGPVGIGFIFESGDIAIANGASHTVARLNRDGVLLREFGSFGSGTEQFAFPHGVAIDQTTGNIFVADAGNDRIQRLSSTLFPLGRFGRGGSGPGEFNAPEGIAIDGNRNVVVADTGNHRIQILDRDGVQIREFGRQGDGPSEMNGPAAVAVIGGTIFVVDRGNNRVQQFTTSGQLLRVFGRAGSGLGEFNAPSGIAIDAFDIIYVVDSGNHRVQALLPPGLIVGDVALPKASTRRTGGKDRKADR